MMIVAAALAATCSWNHPGTDPTTSAPAATLAAMGIRDPELARMIVAGDYSELVTVRRNDRRPLGMSSGDARWCAGEVDTSGWSPDHEEQGRVYRHGGVAVVWYWRCRNMSLWTAPEPDRPGLGPGAAVPGVGAETAAAFPVPEAVPGPASAAGPEPGAGGYYGGSGTAGFPGGGSFSGGGAGGYCVCCGLATVPAVPEPGTWALLLCGAVAAGLFRARGRR